MMIASNAGRGADFVAAAESALASGDLDAVSFAEIERVLTAATRIYAAKVDGADEFPPPLTAADMTATDVVVTVSEMVKAAGLNLFDLSMWFRR
jgi:hypothetical protein